MKYWFAYSGETLVAGRSRMLSSVIADTAITTELLRVASGYYRQLSPPVAEETFVAALIAPLAMRKFGERVQRTYFSSVGEVIRLFASVDPHNAAVNIINGQITSNYEEEAEALARRVVAAFSSQELMLLPRDKQRLQQQETLDVLPGVMTFLLGRDEANRKAFTQYLRRGIRPHISAQAIKEISALRRVLPTFAKRTNKTESDYEYAVRKSYKAGSKSDRCCHH